MGKTRRPRLEANRHFSPHHLVCSRRQTRDRDAGGPRAQAHLPLRLSRLPCAWLSARACRSRKV